VLLLHNQSTAEFKQLEPGQGCNTVGRREFVSVVLVFLLLHNQSTADFKILKPGQGCGTVSAA
jgi:folate-binding Fe-S cluster repair protein YgfZ